jgi:hypothetical protein
MASARNLLIPAPPSEATCEGCRFHIPWSGSDDYIHHGCDLWIADDITGYPTRLPACIAAEAAAREQAAELARLRRVEVAARGWANAAGRQARYYAAKDLAAALEEK